MKNVVIVVKLKVLVNKGTFDDVDGIELTVFDGVNFDVRIDDDDDFDDEVGKVDDIVDNDDEDNDDDVVIVDVVVDDVDANVEVSLDNGDCDEVGLKMPPQRSILSQSQGDIHPVKQFLSGPRYKILFKNVN